MRRILLIAFAVVAACSTLVAAGCGRTTPPSPRPGAPAATTPFVCHPKAPAQMGECIRQELDAEGVKPTEPRLGTRIGVRAQGVDISRWQPHPAFRELHRAGIRFVIVQGAEDCSESNPFFDSQVRAAHEAGMRIGVYIFAEGCSVLGQAAALDHAAASERSRITLGAYVDAEVPAAYPVACAITRLLHYHFRIVGTYGSPGTYRGGRCIGVNWPAEWGLSLAIPLPGYPFSAVKLRQWCGTCVLAGNSGQIDRDEDLGLLELAHPKPRPKPRPPAERRRLIAHWTAERRAVLHRYHLDGCQGNSMGPKCTALRKLEHVLWADLRRLEGSP